MKIRVTPEQLRDAVVIPRRYPGRWAAAVILIILLAMLVTTMVINPRFEWAVVWQYLFAPTILQGLGLTIELTVIATIISLVAGTVLALMRMSANPVLRTVAAAYIWFFRSVPLLVQIIFFYNLSALYPHIGFGFPGLEQTYGAVNVNAIVTPFIAALLGLGFNESAYTAETVRGGILSVNQGQWAAAKAVGFSPAQTVRYVILPQAVKVFLPPFGNQVVNLLKLTSLVSIVALADLLYSAQLIYARNFETIPLLIVVSFWYLVVVSILSYGQSLLERQMSAEPGSAPLWRRTYAAIVARQAGIRSNDNVGTAA